MEPRFEQRLKIPADNFLGDAVGDRRNSQWSRSAICFRNVHPTNRRRKVAPGGQPVPQLVEVISQIGLKFLYRLSIYASRSLVGLHFLEGLQTSRFEMSNGFALIMRLLPSPVGRLPKQDTAAPSVQSHYRTFCPTTDSSVPVSCIGQLILIGATDLKTLPFASRRQVPTFRAKACLGVTPPSSRMPLGPGFRAPPKLVPR